MISTNIDRSCLVIKNDGIGDLILTSGIISEISKICNGQLDLVTCEQHRDIVELMDGIRKPYYVSRDGLQFQPYISRMGLYIPRVRDSDRDVIESIRKKKYTHAIVLRRFIRQNTLIIMSYVKAEQKYCTWQFPTNTTHEVARKFSKSYKHIQGDLKILSELDYYQKFIESIFGRDINPEPRLNISLPGQKSSRQKNVGLCIGGHSVTWPVGYWIDFIKGIQSRGYLVFLFGGDEDKKTGEILESALSGIKNRAGKLSLKESIEILQKMTVVIGNDTGLSHLASLIADPVIVILGGGTFRRYFPWNKNANHYTIYHGLDCFDCDWECRYSQRLCMNMVRSSDLLDYFDEVISGKTVKKQKNLNKTACQYKIAWRRRSWENVYASC
jgi:ADP-heptose:LPS heptosyltransferase